MSDMQKDLLDVFRECILDFLNKNRDLIIENFIRNKIPFGAGIDESFHFKERLIKTLSSRISDYNLSVRALNACDSERSHYGRDIQKIKYIYELCTKTEQDIMSRRNCGKATLKEFKLLLERLNLSLGSKFDPDIKRVLENLY